MTFKQPNIILTHPFLGNYGGMLQAWALWTLISKLQADTTLAVYIPPQKSPTLLSYIKSQIKLLRYALEVLPFRSPGLMSSTISCANSFLRHAKTRHLVADSSYTDCVRNETTWIVGSDQVWRAEYARQMKSVPFFFLSFLSEAARRKSIAYAASFGTDEWGGTSEETKICRKMLQQFKAVSVRENSGVSICRDVFGVDAVQVPDPTLVVELDDYQTLIDSEDTYQIKTPYIAAYILDRKLGALGALQDISDTLKIQVQQLMPNAWAKRRRDRYSLSVPQWLRYMKESSFVVTDSFHGCVFAIIFNKPFVCLGNEGRGSARFDTLFQTFHLESRLATSPEQAVTVAQAPIDWDAVNAIHEAERARGLAFLRENLK